MSWLSKIYRKFESVCEDAEEVSNHESIKYIERKVQNIGENVMKFYSKLAEVIVSPIFFDPSMSDQEEADDALISYFKSLLGIEDEHFLENLTDMPIMPMPSLENNHFEDSDTFSNIEASFSSSEDDLPPLEDVFDSEESDFGRSQVSSNTSSTLFSIQDLNLLPNKAFAAYYTTLHNHDSIITSQIYDSDETYSSSFASSIQSFGLSDDDNGYETIAFNKEADGLFDQVELEENCVVVDYTTPHVDFSNEAALKKPSFKRSIMDALCSKKRLVREYKKLAILQGTNLPAAQQTMLLMDSQTIQSSDSEWEIL